MSVPTTEAPKPPSKTRIYINWFSDFAIKQVGLSLLEAIAVKFLWNNSIVNIIPAVVQITFNQAFLLILLIKILSRSWHQSLIRNQLTTNNLSLNNANFFLQAITGYLSYINNFLLTTTITVTPPIDKIKVEVKSPEASSVDNNSVK